MSRRPPPRPAHSPRRSGRPLPPPAGGGRLWIYGMHAVEAALANPARPCHRLLVAQAAGDEVLDRLAAAGARAMVPRPAAETCARPELEALLPPGAVHQGVVLLVSPLPETGVDAAWEGLADGAGGVAVVLDQATDPRNVGAVLRSAAAFGARAVIVQSRHAPDETAALAKAASGALERVPLVQATNLVRAMDELKANGFWCVGLDARAPGSLAEADLTGRVALVLGSEGGGLRRLVRESCDLLARIPMSGAVESLNLSNAAAVALYETARGRKNS
ncbi:MAG: 23S rRNA (guanosine(2251)-2'-O)-methyltransferase RlmB [Magnetospirillum sp. WYHS-4]